MLKNFNYFPISTKNCFIFNKETFDLSIFYEELKNFFYIVNLDNDIYYAHSFNKEGLFHNPYPIKGFQVRKLDYHSSFFSFFSDKDITFATDIENNKFDNNFNTLYKYNILILYAYILKSFVGQNHYSWEFKNDNIQNFEFYLFISKHCINNPEFYLFKEKFLNEYKNK